MTTVKRHGRPLVDDEARLAGVAALGVDEHETICVSRTRTTFFAAIFVDVALGRNAWIQLQPGG